MFTPQDLIDAVSESENFRDTEIHVVCKKGGTRPISHATMRNGHLFLVPDFDTDKDEFGVIDP